MSSPANPALRALRRLVARDPDRPIRLQTRGIEGAAAALLRWTAAAAQAPLAELLAGNRKPRIEAPSAQVVDAGRRFARLLPGLARYRRPASLTLCAVILAGAGFSALPSISMAGEPSAPPALIDPGLADQQDPGRTGDFLGYDPLDAAVYNTIQSDELPAGKGFQWYTVRGGDGLNKIAGKFSLHANTVYWANKNRLPNLNTIAIGTRLLIPPVDGVVVTVKSGVTVSSLASKYHVTAQSIVVANALPNETLKSGQMLVIPTAVAAIPAQKAAAPVYAGGSLRWPVVGRYTISQYFTSTHWALDLAANTGTPVVAAATGTVIYAGWKRSGYGSGGGIVVWLNHNGKIWTTYNHLSAEFVSVGQTVTAGQRIGSVGMTGLATGPHLHFEVWVCSPWCGGTTAGTRNPLRYLR